jgi:hypothetical protein
MSLSMHDLAIPLFVRILEAMKGMLDKAVAHAETSGYDPAVLLEARLYPDMWSLRQQVAAATAFGVRGVARLAGVDVPTLPETLDTFPDLHKRIDETLAFVRAADRDAVDAGPARELTVPWGKEQKAMTGLLYFQAIALPNVYFHATTTYDILRHNGVPLSKVDFTGPF